MSSVNYTSFTHSLSISPSTCSKRMPTSVIALKILMGQSFTAKCNAYFAMSLFKDSLDLVSLVNPFLILSLLPFTLTRTLTLTCIRVHSFRASSSHFQLSPSCSYGLSPAQNFLQHSKNIYLITCSRGSKTLGSIRIIWKACSKSDF